MGININPVPFRIPNASGSYPTLASFTPFYYNAGAWSDGGACSILATNDLATGGTAVGTSDSTGRTGISSSMNFTSTQSTLATGSTQEFEVMNTANMGFDRFIGAAIYPYPDLEKTMTLTDKYLNSTSWMYTIRMSDTKIMILYESQHSSAQGDTKAICGTLSGGTLTLGSAVNIDGGGLNRISGNVHGALIGTDEVAVTYLTSASAWSTVILSVSGTTITVNTPVALTNTAAGTIDGTQVTKLGASKYLVFQGDTNTNIECQVCTYDGSFNITANTAVQDGAANGDSIFASVQLDTDVIAVDISASSSSTSNHYSRVITVSGTTPTIGAEFQITGVESIRKSLFKITTTKWLVGGAAQATLLTRSGTTITVQQILTLTAGDGDFNADWINTGGFYYLYNGRNVNKISESSNVLTKIYDSNSNFQENTAAPLYGTSPGVLRLSDTEVFAFQTESATTSVTYVYVPNIDLELYNDSTLLNSPSTSVPLMPIFQEFRDTIDILGAPMYFGIKNVTTTYSVFPSIEGLNLRLK